MTKIKSKDVKSNIGIGTIIIEIRFSTGQMDGAPSVKSSYKLVTKDWSGLLGAFRR